MKKLLCFVLSAMMILSFFGCAEEEIPIIDNSAQLSSAPESESSLPESSIEQSSVSQSETSSESSLESSLEESSSSSSQSKPESSSSSQSSKPQSSSSSNKSESSSQSSSSSSSKEESSSESSSSKVEQENSASPIGETKAVWISYLEYQSILQGKSKNQFTNSIKTMFGNLTKDGFNTVYVHARSHSDAMYDSDIFPWSVYCTGTEGSAPGFDPLAIMVNEAHKAGLRIEAWINPYRIKGTSNTSKIANSSPAKKWLGTDNVIVIEGKGIYYNPAKDEVIDLIVSGVEEIVKNYDVDGIHFDDYFYPTTDESFDRENYRDYTSNGGTKDLGSWRRSNVNTLIKRVYSAIKAIDPNCRFGISPAGNMEQNYNTHYCDVKTWVTSAGYIDYICPQIYFGFNNKTRPYLTVLDEFSSIITRKDVELIVGLAAYKSGAEDTYAGASGKTEWIQQNDILARQVIAARNEKNYGGFALYRYDSVYNPTAAVKTAVNKEMDNLKEIM